MLDVGELVGVSGNLQPQLGDEWAEFLTGTIKGVGVGNVGWLGVGITRTFKFGEPRGNHSLFGQLSFQLHSTCLVGSNFRNEVLIGRF
jgi:hypothetical protein